MKPSQIYQFTANISKYDFGKYYYTVVFLPPELIPQLPFKEYPKLRVKAEINGAAMEGAFMPDKGRWYLMTPRKMLKSLNKQLGDEVQVEFCIADQNEVHLPSVLEEYLKQDEDFKQKWDKLTAGKKRGLAYSISKIKTPEIRERKLLEIIESI